MKGVKRRGNNLCFFLEPHSSTRKMNLCLILACYAVVMYKSRLSARLPYILHVRRDLAINKILIE